MQLSSLNRIAGALGLNLQFSESRYGKAKNRKDTTLIVPAHDILAFKPVKTFKI